MGSNPSAPTTDLCVIGGKMGARSSVDQSIGLLNRRSQVRILPGVPIPIVVGVAQLVEHRIVAPEVAGSNPVTHPTCRTTQPEASGH